MSENQKQKVIHSEDEELSPMAKFEEAFAEELKEEIKSHREQEKKALEKFVCSDFRLF